MIHKIKYNRALLKNKIRLEKELAMVRTEIIEEQKDCKHIPAMLYYGEINCILCGKEMPEAEDYVDVVKHNPISNDESYSEYMETRVKYIQDLAIEYITSNPNLTSEELFKILKERHNKNKQKIKK